ncbi:hypothetical protein BJY00DRAFT_300464 [Aspergillus carlsbadensis]|nr:hypothetical protein BJY00DRAFT_300464 [Aspergillus carlsbadensis]
MAAVMRMLDKIHINSDRRQRDDNTYVVGRLAGHNCALACLPVGVYGTTSATSVAIGIGGGVPNPANDIRLGDVVVGVPSPKHDGVIQYDYGKTLAEGKFIRTGSLNKPPVALLTAISKLQAETRTQRCASISDMRGAEHDCTGCNLYKAVQRPTRDLDHSKVIKDAATRDRLAKELGILCFEMEAAGLANFLFLSIRGICDYADSRKNKRWQGYSAATAAAYAKKLLTAISPMESCTISNPTVDDSRAKEDNLLTSLHFDQLQSRQYTIKGAHARTCKWLLRHEIYRQWLDPFRISQNHGFLWIKGKPGAGKSTIMKYAFEDARRTGGQGATIISFFFNARGEILERSTIGMYRSLLWQILTAAPETRRVLDNLSSTDEMASVARLQDLFLSSIMQILGRRPVVAFIDALDECQEEEVREMPLHICFSSRHYPHITFGQGLEMVLEGQESHDQDLKSYINSKLASIKDPQIDEVKIEFFEKESGIILWVVIMVDILRRAYDHGRMNAVRQRLQEILPKLSELFKDILFRDRENMEDLFICLQWILFAKRPLSPHELFLAIQAHEETLLRLNAMQPAENSWMRFLSASKGLAEITKSRKSPTVQFIHESVRDFLLKDDGITYLIDEMGIALVYRKHDLSKMCCLNYINATVPRLSNRQQELPQAKSAEAIALRTKTSTIYPFLEYAAAFILEHTDDAAAEGISQNDFIRRYTDAAPLMYISADRGLPSLVHVAVQQGLPICSPDERYCCSIIAALQKDNLRVAQVKDRLRSLFNPQGFTRGDPSTQVLLSLLRNCRLDLLRTLLESRALDVNTVFSSQYSHHSLLTYTIENKRLDCVKMLLDHGADANMPARGTYLPPLCRAIQQENMQIIHWLIDAGADVNHLGSDCSAYLDRTPLEVAITQGNQAIIDVLLAAGADVELTYGSEGKYPLLDAVSKEREIPVGQLLSAGANPNGVITDKDREAMWQETPLHIAILRDNRATLRAYDGSNPMGVRSLIFYAFMKDRVHIAKWLLQPGMPNLKESTGKPLSPPDSEIIDNEGKFVLRLIGDLMLKVGNGKFIALF